MAVKAQAQVTLSKTVDVSGVTRYYKLQSSTLAKPAKPAAKPPSGWTATEPAYAEGATSSLYTCELTTFSDGSWAYSDVSLSSSYEAAKKAYNEALAAKEAAEGTAQRFFADVEGAHVTTADGDAGSGPNVLVDSGGIAVRDGKTVLARFRAALVELGINAASAVIKLCGGKGRVSFGGNTLTVASDAGAGGARVSSSASDVAVSTCASVIAHNKGTIGTEGATVQMAPTDKPRAMLIGHELVLWNNASLDNPRHVADMGRAGALLDGTDWTAYSTQGYTGKCRILPNGWAEVVGTCVRTMGDFHCDLMTFDTLRAILGKTAAQLPVDTASAHVAVANGHWEANAASLECAQVSQTGVVRVTKRDGAGSCVGSIRINYRVLLTNVK